MLNTAPRFAQVSYRLFAHEGTFRIEVPDGEDFEANAQEFERVGCSVERELETRCLTVTCPARTLVA